MSAIKKEAKTLAQVARERLTAFGWTGSVGESPHPLGVAEHEFLAKDKVFVNAFMTSNNLCDIDEMYRLGLNTFFACKVKPKTSFQLESTLGFHSSLLAHPGLFYWSNLISVAVSDPEYIDAVPAEMAMASIILGFYSGSLKVNALFRENTACSLSNLQRVAERIGPNRLAGLLDQSLNEFSMMNDRGFHVATLSLAFSLSCAGYDQVALHMLTNPRMQGMEEGSSQVVLNALVSDVAATKREVLDRFMSQFMSMPVMDVFTERDFFDAVRVSLSSAGAGHWFEDFIAVCAQLAPQEDEHDYAVKMISSLTAVKNQDSPFFDQVAELPVVDFSKCDIEEATALLEAMSSPKQAMMVLKQNPFVISDLCETMPKSGSVYHKQMMRFISALSGVSVSGDKLSCIAINRLFSEMSAIIERAFHKELMENEKYFWGIRQLESMVKFAAGLISPGVDVGLVEKFVGLLVRNDVKDKFIGWCENRSVLSTTSDSRLKKKIITSDFGL